MDLVKQAINCSTVERSTTNLKHGELTDQIIGVFYDVYNELGNGFLESVYRQSLLIALRAKGFNAHCEVPISVWFRGERVGEFRVDLLVEGKVVLELKCARTLESAHEAQLLHYLKSSEIEVGLLLNFGPRPQVRRLLFDNDRKKIRGNPCESVAEVHA